MWFICDVWWQSTLAFWAYWKKKRENLILTVTHLPLTASLLQFDRDQGRVFNRQDQGHFRQTLIQDSLTRERITQCIWLFLLSMFSSKVEQPQSCFMHQTWWKRYKKIKQLTLPGMMFWIQNLAFLHIECIVAQLKNLMTSRKVRYCNIEASCTTLLSITPILFNCGFFFARLARQLLRGIFKFKEER